MKPFGHWLRNYVPSKLTVDEITELTGLGEDVIYARIGHPDIKQVKRTPLSTAQHLADVIDTTLANAVSYLETPEALMLANLKPPPIMLPGMADCGSDYGDLPRLFDWWVKGAAVSFDLTATRVIDHHYRKGVKTDWSLERVEPVAHYFGYPLSEAIATCEHVQLILYKLGNTAAREYLYDQAVKNKPLLDAYNDRYGWGL